MTLPSQPATAQTAPPPPTICGWFAAESVTLSKMWALVAALTPPVKMELEMYCSSTWPGMGEKGWLLGLSREEEERRMKLTREEDG